MNKELMETEEYDLGRDGINHFLNLGTDVVAVANADGVLSVNEDYVEECSSEIVKFANKYGYNRTEKKTTAKELLESGVATIL